jgi:hypothetical protein
MTWEVEYTEEFYAWWNRLDEVAQDRITAAVELLMAEGFL